MNRVFLSFGSIKIYWYSITMLLGVLAGVFLAINESKKHNLKDYIEDLIFYTIIFGIIGARLYYVIFNFEPYKNDFLSIFKIWEGGIAIYGALIGGFLTILYKSKKAKKNLIETTDIVVPGVILGQAIGRWGNFFNGEAHGMLVTYEYLKNMHIPEFIIKGMNIDGLYYIPTFLYESLWCLLGFIILIIIRKLTKREKGYVTYSYFIWYGIGRIIIEGMRTDSLYLGSIRISQLVSLILIIIGIIGIILNIKNKESKLWKKKNTK